MTIADDIAKELLSVQPMPSDIWQKLMAAAMNEKDLKEPGIGSVEITDDGERAIKGVYTDR